MELTLTTPAIFFPTVSLLMVAYTNRYLALARRIRELHNAYRDAREGSLGEQIRVLRKRVRLIRLMQALAVSALLLCLLCMLLLFAGAIATARAAFVSSLLLLMASLGMSLFEVLLSVRALDIALGDMEDSITD